MSDDVTFVIARYHLSVSGRKTPPRLGLARFLANMFAVIEKIHCQHPKDASVRKRTAQSPMMPLGDCFVAALLAMTDSLLIFLRGIDEAL
jgi:hypothetical protein